MVFGKIENKQKSASASTMFKFNFNEETTPEKFEEKPTDLATEYKESKLVDVDYTETADHVRNSKVNCFVSNEHEVGYLDNGTFTGTTDLIPRVYEGGFKIWECTQDLADLITSSDENVFSEKNVCDLGCSAGILGIIALAFGAKHIDFQDYVSFFYILNSLFQKLLHFRTKTC